LELAGELGARLVIDLGCGTGLLTRALAGEGREVIGVDPSPAMLAVAQRGPGAGNVRWITYGDWGRGPLQPESRSIVTVARRA